DETDVRAVLNALVSHGVLQRVGDDTEPRYRARTARRRPRVLPDRLWTAVEELDPGTPLHDAAPRREGFPLFRLGLSPLRGGGAPPRQRWSGRGWGLEGGALLGERGRLFLCASPLAVGFLLTEWLFSRNSQNFTGLSNFVGLILICVLGA